MVGWLVAILLLMADPALRMSDSLKIVGCNVNCQLVKTSPINRRNPRVQKGLSFVDARLE